MPRHQREDVQQFVILGTRIVTSLLIVNVALFLPVVLGGIATSWFGWVLAGRRRRRRRWRARKRALAAQPVAGRAVLDVRPGRSRPLGLTRSNPLPGVAAERIAIKIAVRRDDARACQPGLPTTGESRQRAAVSSAQRSADRSVAVWRNCDTLPLSGQTLRNPGWATKDRCRHRTSATRSVSTVRCEAKAADCDEES